MFQAELIPDKSPPTVLLADGILTPMIFLQKKAKPEKLGRALLNRPEFVESELERAKSVLGKSAYLNFPYWDKLSRDEELVEYLVNPWRDYPTQSVPLPVPKKVAVETVKRFRDSKETIDTVGFIQLTHRAAIEFFPENFSPQHWIQNIDQLQDDRRIYTYNATRRNGTTTKIVIKSQKQGLNFWPSDENKLFGGSIRLYKESKTEFDDLRAISLNGGKVERPLGYFRQGKEQWLYTQYVEGQNPLDILAQDNMREEFWKSDARLLAALCKSNLRHMGFYSEKFDDKVWNNGMTLIDVDEDVNMLNSHIYPGYSKEHPELLLEGYRGFLKDCLVSYQHQGQMTRGEARMYTQEFSKTMSIPIDIEEISTPQDNNYTTLESWVSAMSDCD